MAKLKIQIPGRTFAFGRFADTGYRTNRLLEVGLAGVKTATSASADLLKIFDKNLQQTRSAPLLSIAENPIVTEIVSLSHDVLLDSPFHFHGMLLVSIWGAFETYLHDIFRLIFLCDPDLLRSERHIGFNDALRERDNLLDYLVSLELKHAMRLNFDDLKDYIKSRFRYDFAESVYTELRDVRSVRNVVAHSNGFLVKPGNFRLPAGVTLDVDKIQISTGFLKRASKVTSEAAVKFDFNATTKWRSLEVAPPREISPRAG